MKPASKEIAEHIARVYRYEPHTGELIRKIAVGKFKAGTRAGWIAPDGRCQVVVLKRAMRRTHLIWFLVHSAWPTGFIDHIDGNPGNDRLENLREATPLMNSQNVHRAFSSNVSTGFLGVTKTTRGRFRAKLRAEGKYVNVGTFQTAEEAHAAYLQEKRRLHVGCTI